MLEENIDETVDQLRKQQRRQDLLLFLVGAILFSAALYFGLNNQIHDLFSGQNLPSTGKMRALELRSPDHSVDALMLAGTSVSLSLSIFAYLQYRRLKVSFRSQRKAEAKLRHQALNDSLTGLPNRRAFEEFGRALLAEDNSLRAVLLVDLDKFKPVNDVHGHAAGDLVLREFAARLRDKFPGGIFARFGGDEFAAITPQLAQESDAARYAALCLDAAVEKFRYGDIDLHIGASIGISFLGREQDSTAQSLRRADIALYDAKAGGRRQFASYRPEMEKDIRERFQQEDELRRAIANREIIPYFQPIVDLESGETIGFEALARWKHPERGIVLPGEFIPMAENLGLVGELSAVVISSAAAIARDWPAHIVLSINLSPIQLRDPGIARKVLDILAANDFPASRLEVEITENALISDLEAASETIGELRAAGVSIALDDFGTGVSTLNHLRACRFDKLKIDRSFIHTMEQSHDSRTIVGAIVDLSRSFGIRCTAEGIENQSELDALRKWGCSQGQGYLFGKPGAAAEFVAAPSSSKEMHAAAG